GVTGRLYREDEVAAPSIRSRISHMTGHISDSESHYAFRRDIAKRSHSFQANPPPAAGTKPAGSTRMWQRLILLVVFITAVAEARSAAVATRLRQLVFHLGQGI